MYKRKPCGEHLVSVCTNTLCAVLGGDAIYAKLHEHLGEDGAPLGHEETVGRAGRRRARSRWSTPSASPRATSARCSR